MRRFGQRLDQRHVETVAAERQPLQQRERLIGNVAEPVDDRFGGARGQAAVAHRRGAAGELDRRERVTVRSAKDARQQRVVERRGSGALREAAAFVVLERLEVDELQRAGALQANEAAAECALRRDRPGAQQHAERSSGHRQLHQRVDVGVVGEVRVVDLQQPLGAFGGGQQQATDGAHDLVPAERSGQRLRRRGEPREQREHVRRAVAQPVEQRAVVEQPPLGDRPHHGVRAAGFRRRDAQHVPAARLGGSGDLARERRLADPGRAAHDESARPLAVALRQPRHGLRQRHGTTDERRPGGMKSGDAALVHAFGLRIGSDAQRFLQRIAQMRVPAQRRSAVARLQLALHQRPVRGLVGGFEERELLHCPAVRSRSRWRACRRSRAASVHAS